MPAKRGKAAATVSERASKRSKTFSTEPQLEAANGILEETKAVTEIDDSPIEENANEVAAMSKKRKREPSGSALPIIPSPYTQGGQVFVCGQGDSGQLGLGNLEDDDDMGEVARPRPSPLSNLNPKVGFQNPKVTQVTAGGMHSVALTQNGEVFSTGVNDEAALGRKTDANIYKNVDGTPGDAYKWGQVTIPSDMGKIIQVSAGDSHTAALTELGAVYSWGVFRGDSGPWLFLPGQEYALEPVLVYTSQSPQTQIVQISSGADHVLAMRRDGSVLSWGYGAQGQLGRLGSRMRNPEETMLLPGLVPLHNIQGVKGRSAKAASISAGTFGSFIMTTAGQTLAFGVNASGQLGFSTEGERVDLNLIQRPKLVDSLHGLSTTAIGAGKSHTVALTSNGTVYSFGLPVYGRLGRKDVDTASDKPVGPGLVEISCEDSLVSVAAGAETSAIVTTGGDAFVFGIGHNRQLARVSEDDAELPWKVKKDKFATEAGVSRILQVSMGGQHTLLLAQ